MSYSFAFVRVCLAAWLPAVVALAQTNGSVGIGTTTPTQALDVNGGLLVRGYRAVSNQGAYLQWNRTGGDGNTWLLNQKGLGAGAIVFGSVTTSDAATEWGRFASNGYLGIGTSMPTAPLTVQADGSNSNYLLLGFTNSNGTDKYNFSLAGGGLNLSESNQAGGRLFVQDGSGNVGLGTTSPKARLDVESGGLLVGGSGSLTTQGASLQWNRSGGEGETYLINNLGTGNTATAGIRFGGAIPSGALTEWARFQNNGYLGLGTTTPGARLEVAGQVKITGGTPGLGKVLTSDANGLATWEPIIGATTFNSIQNQATTAQNAVFHISGSGRVDGDNQGFITDAGGYARVGLMKYGGHEGGLWRTSSQDLEIGRVNVSDLTTATGSNAFVTDLYVDGSGNVGIGTGAVAAALLHVGGTAGTSNVRFESLGSSMAGTRFVTADASGNLGSSDGSGSFIRNQTAQQTSSNFNVSGAGTVGGLFTVGGGTTVTGVTNINAMGGNATTTIGSGGNVSIGGSTATLNPSGVLTLGGSSLTSSIPGSVTLFNGGNFSARGEGAMSLTGSSSFSAYSNGAMSLSAYTNVSVSSSTGTLSLNSGLVNSLTLNAGGIGGNVGVGGSAPTSRLHIMGAMALPITNATYSTSLTNDSHTVRCTAGCSQLTLPDASTCAGREYVLLNSKTNTAAVTLLTSGSQAIIDDTTAPNVTSLPIGSRYTIQSDGSNWVVIGR